MMNRGRETVVKEDHGGGFAQSPAGDATGRRQEEAAAAREGESEEPREEEGLELEACCARDMTRIASYIWI